MTTDGEVIPASRQAAHRKIADSLRNQILRDELTPGQQLPSKGELMKRWNSSSFTIHTALQALIKEGWIESIHGSGTYVAQPQNRFVCAGIYHGQDICSEQQSAFARRIHVALLTKFRELGKETLVFMDTRPSAEQTTLLPSLADAILHRRIQCLVFPLPSADNLPELNRLRMPIATLSAPPPRAINYDMENLFRGSARSFAQAGCRSVGLISSFFINPAEGRHPFYDLFRKAMHDEGIRVCPEWVGEADHFIPPPDLELHGYMEFNRRWPLREKPDGLMVYPDILARGVILAILAQNRDEVCRKMTFLFHRNAHLPYLCPFPVLWAISDEDALADALVAQIQRQFEGRRPSSVLLPYSFASDFAEAAEKAAIVKTTN